LSLAFPEGDVSCMRWTLRCTVMFLLISGTGCYYYQPLENPTPSPGTPMQIMLTDSGTSHLWGYLGPDVGQLRGRLISADTQALALSVESVEQRHGQILSWKGEPVTLRREYVATMQERHLSKGRIALLASGSVVAFVATVTALTQLVAGAGNGGGGGPPK
jgi:hypothetical protein